MTLPMERTNFPVSKSFGYQISTNPIRRFTPRSKLDKNRKERTILENVTKHVFPGGVRAPILADITSREKGKAIQFDIVTPRQQKAAIRFFQKDNKIDQNRNFRRSDIDLSLSPRSIRFLRPDGTTYKHVPHRTNRSTEAWDEWKDDMKKKTKDARDILYRNTYSYDAAKLRYNVCKLPRISQERPWTVDGVPSDNTQKNAQTTGESLLLSHLKQSAEQKRPTTMHASKRLTTSRGSDVKNNEGCFEVRRINTSTEIANDSTPLTAIVRQPSDLGTDAENQRPMKYEMARPKLSHADPKKNYQGRKKMTMLTEREYKSVEAYKQYVETMQKRGIEGKSSKNPRNSRNSANSLYGQENRALQSVMDVNQPDGINPLDKNSIVIEIRSTWDEQMEKDQDDGRSCPMNSPIPEITTVRTNNTSGARDQKDA